MKEKYVAFDPVDHEWGCFETIEEAKAWIENIEFIDGFPEELEMGHYFIAKTILRTKIKKVAKKSDYHEHNEGCPDDCNEEEWPYSDSYDYIGEIEFEKVEGRKKLIFLHKGATEPRRAIFRKVDIGAVRHFKIPFVPARPFKLVPPVGKGFIQQREMK